MKVYVSKRNENVTAKIIKEDEKFKTVVIEYLTGDKVGQNNSITTSTLKRWWKVTEVSDDVMEESTVESEEPVNSSETLVPMLGIEKLSDLKKETLAGKENAKNNKYKIDDILPKVLSSLHDYIVKPYSTNRNYLVVKTNTEKPKRLAEVDVLSKKVTVYMRKKVDNLPEGISFHKFVNNTLGNCYHISYDCDYIKNIRYLLDFQKEGMV